MPRCLSQWRALGEIKSLVADGDLQIRLLIQYGSERGEIAANAMHLSTLVSDDVAWDAVGAIKGNVLQGRSLLSLRGVVDEILGDGGYVLGVESYAQDLARRYGQTKRVRLLESVSGTPHMWIYRRGQTVPDRHFSGYTGPTIVRLALESALNK